VIRPGDTLDKVAGRNGINIIKLQHFNEMTSDELTVRFVRYQY
jgi:hypothetical protein